MGKENQRYQVYTFPTKRLIKIKYQAKGLEHSEEKEKSRGAMAVNCVHEDMFLGVQNGPILSINSLNIINNVKPFFHEDPQERRKLLDCAQD